LRRPFPFAGELLASPAVNAQPLEDRLEQGSEPHAAAKEWLPDV